MPRGRVSFNAAVELTDFEVLSAPGGAYACPREVPFQDARIAHEARPVAALLAERGALDWERPPPLDAQDHWYRTTIPALPGGGHTVLVCEGLATLCEIWIGDEHVLSTDNMFAPHELALPAARAGESLTLCFRSLTGELAKRRPRPRYRTRLVEQQQLRYVRTSLLGRTPGFCPNLPVVGPYLPLRIERRRLRVEALRVEARPLEQRGIVRVSLTLEEVDGSLAKSDAAALVLRGEAGSGRAALTVERTGERLRIYGELAIDNARRWWPHTHGEQPLSELAIEFAGCRIELGRVGFRELALDRGDDGRGFGLTINGVPLFARGACWTTDDLTFSGAKSPEAALRLARDAGMNMLRVTGTTAYESGRFYDLCDELGLLVFQDFMFANMDYPASDPAFLASVEREVRAQLTRLAARPCLAVLCGGSEVQQQAAMLAMPRELWSNALFDELLPRLAAEHAVDVPYVPSTPVGGDLPFQVDEGLSHYYGVGAYLRPLEDARRADVRFAAECLAFANAPCAASIERFMGDLEAPFHHPRWKQRVPRDRGASWDFEDVRDHYIEALFGVEPRALRSTDVERYLALGHAAVGEAMTAAFSEWRRVGSRCRGGLVFWYKDLWPGAGWGVVDGYGVPKPVYYYLKRVFAARALVVTDEGLNGLALHALNESAEPLSARLELDLVRAGETVIAHASTELTIAPRGAARVRADALLPHFTDVSYAYRFGPPNHELVAARLVVGGEVCARAFHFPLGRAVPVEPDVGLTAKRARRDGLDGVLVATRRFAQCVTLDVSGYTPEDDYFHLEPGGSRFIALKAVDERERTVRGTVAALNARTRAPIAEAGD